MSSNTTSGRSRSRLVERLAAVRGLTDDHEPVGLQQRPRRRTERRMVVDDQHGRAHVLMLAVQVPDPHCGQPQCGRREISCRH